MPACGRRAGAAGIDDEVAGIDIPAERLVSPDGNEGYEFGSPPAAQPGSLKQDGIIGLRDPVEGGGPARGLRSPRSFLPVREAGIYRSGR
jgi:hypothetical protein